MLAPCGCTPITKTASVANEWRQFPSTSRKLSPPAPALCNFWLPSTLEGLSWCRTLVIHNSGCLAAAWTRCAQSAAYSLSTHHGEDGPTMTMAMTSTEKIARATGAVECNEISANFSFPELSTLPASPTNSLAASRQHLSVGCPLTDSYQSWMLITAQTWRDRGTSPPSFMLLQHKPLGKIYQGLLICAKAERLPKYTLLLPHCSPYNPSPQIPDEHTDRDRSPTRPHEASSLPLSNARVLLFGRMPSIILLPILANPLRLRKRLRPTKGLDNIPLALQNLQPEACARIATLANGTVVTPPSHGCFLSKLTSRSVPRNMTVQQPNTGVVGLERDGDVATSGHQYHVPARRVDELEALVAVDRVEGGVFLSEDDNVHAVPV